MGALFGGGPKMPAPPPPPPPAAAPPTMANANVSQAGNMARARAGAAASGFSGTVQNLGGAPGLTEQASSAPRSLLG